MGKTIGYVELPQDTLCPLTQKQLRENDIPKVAIRTSGGPEISCSHCLKGRHYASDFRDIPELYNLIIEGSANKKRQYKESQQQQEEEEEEEEELEEDIPDIQEIDRTYYELNMLWIENGNAIAKWYQDKTLSSPNTPGKHTHGSMIRGQLWKKIFNFVTHSQCPVCALNPISFDNYSLGHIHPESRNGSNTINNLLPICSTCNTLMGTQHLYYYAWTVYKKALWPVNTF